VKGTIDCFSRTTSPMIIIFVARGGPSGWRARLPMNLNEASLDRPGVVPETPSAGTAASMAEVLGAVARINDDAGRGVLDEEMRAIAESAGMDPRGVAGYYSAGLLEKRSDGTRWILQERRDRLERLVAIQRVHLLDDHESASGPSAPRRPKNTSRRPV
jgi:hypothetical protein